MAEIRLRGRPASPGFAAGPVIVLATAGASARAAGDPAREQADLRAALDAAAAELAALAETAAADAADMLGFQIALIEDDALTEGAFAAIAGGTPADAAWRAALDAEILGYEAVEDDYFRARAADLADLRDRVTAHLAGEGGPGGALPRAPILAAHDLPPSRFLGIDWSAGGAILLTGGSPSSHVAMLARSRGVPMIVGLGADPGALAGDALVDAVSGEVVIDPAPETRPDFEARRAAARQAGAAAQGRLTEPAVTADGTPIRVHINIAGPDELEALDPAICDGIGLVRTEFLFDAAGRLPDEETQYAAYRRMLEWAGERPVTIRTLDAGGDKPIRGLTLDGESNPFLGVRGIRLSLRRPEVFRVQLRALLRAAVHGALKVMLPMVTVPAEVEATRVMMREELAALDALGVAARWPALGIMVEVPAVALALDRFEVDFVSIGSNDLTQYATAAGRDIGAVADLADPLHPGVLALIAEVARAGAAGGYDVSLCGDAGADPAAIPALLAAGLRSVSVAPAQLASAKAAIASLDLGAR